MGLRSIKEIYVIGHGPSSSHTIGPYNAAKHILNKYKKEEIKIIEVTLYGSLAHTGKGHLTDYIISLAFKDISHQIIFDTNTKKKHPNTILFKISLTNGKEVKEEIYSIGGGSIAIKDTSLDIKEIYPHQHMKEIASYCEEHKISLFQYVDSHEEDIIPYMQKVLKTMDEAVERGLKAEGYLPGTLKVKRKAKKMFEGINDNPLGVKDVPMNVAINAFAVSEENAAGGVIVTAPTCGSSGVIPGCIRYLRMKNVSEEKILEGLAVAGLFGIVCKINASVSGAVGGCQAEIGVASSMGAAMIAYCFNLSMVDIIQAAEIALEHSLGLTCDPVGGYVQIPCIERCAVYAVKAIDAVKLAMVIPDDDIHVGYDDSIRTMFKTGKDMSKKYKETSLGGLAEIIK